MEFDFYYNKRERGRVDQKHEVKIQCYYNRKYKLLPTGVFLVPAEWDQKTNFIIKKHDSFSSISKILNDKITDIRNKCYHHEATGGIFDFKILNDSFGKIQTITFADFIQSEMKSEILDMKSFSRYSLYLEFLKNTLPDTGLTTLSSQDINRYDRELRRKYTTGSVTRNHIWLKKYIKRAIRKGYIQRSPYDQTDIALIKPESTGVPLTDQNIKELEELTDLTPSQMLVRDRFLYSCYTGLRKSDNLALKKSCIQNTDDGLIVKLHTIKGYGHNLIHPVRLMFDGKPEKIILKWITAHDGDTVFPRQSLSNIDEQLEIIIRKTGIQSKVTFHTSRHTCATNLAEITQNPFLLMNLMGWADMKTAMRYIHASPETTKKQLRVYTGKW